MAGDPETISREEWESREKRRLEQRQTRPVEEYKDAADEQKARYAQKADEQLSHGGEGITYVDMGDHTLVIDRRGEREMREVLPRSPTPEEEEDDG